MDLAFLESSCKINTGTKYGIDEVLVMRLQNVTNPIK